MVTARCLPPFIQALCDSNMATSPIPGYKIAAPASEAPSPAGPSEPPTPPARQSDGDSFQALAREWKATRGHTSSAARMAKNPAYQKIIGLGEAAVPLILAELRKEPDHWFLALHALTGADPVPPESRGKVADMAAAWLAWGKERRYIK